jgi:hypothetical protein
MCICISVCIILHINTTLFYVSYNIVQHVVNVVKGLHQCCFNVIFLEAREAQQLSQEMIFDEQ